MVFAPIGLTWAKEDSQSDLIFVQIPAAAEPAQSPSDLIFLPSARYVDGCRIVCLSLTDSNAVPKNLTPEFLSAQDPAVSFDGETILFAGKKSAADSWSIWRMNRDGSGKVEITPELNDCVSPLFVGGLFYLNDDAPSDQIVFMSGDHNWINEQGSTPAYSLYVSNLEGKNCHRITFNLSGDFDPDVLPNGRVVFTSWQRYGGRFAPTGMFSLLEVSIDGTDLMPFYGNFEKPVFKGMIRVSDGDRIYFIESDRSTWLGGGRIAYVSFRRPLHSHHILCQDANGLYHSPCPLPDGGLIAPYRPNNDETPFGLYRIDPESGERLETIYQDDAWRCLDAHVLGPHPRVKGRSSVVNFELDKGVFYCLNTYESDRPEAKAIEPGSIARMRVIEGVPLLANQPPLSTYSATPFGLRRILGQIPVEADGSFHIEVPSQTPIAFQLLDKNGMALMTHRSWIWAMPKEMRGCAGCHEDRELAPSNLLVKAVVKPPYSLTLPPEKRRTTDFKHNVVPILKERCVLCHSEGMSPFDLDFEEQEKREDAYNPAYKTLLGKSGERQYIIPGDSRESPLVWNLFGEKLGSSPYSGIVEMMPPGEALSSLEKRIIVEWIDIGAQWDNRVAFENN